MHTHCCSWLLTLDFWRGVLKVFLLSFPALGSGLDFGEWGTAMLMLWLWMGRGWILVAFILESFIQSSFVLVACVAGGDVT